MSATIIKKLKNEIKWLKKQKEDESKRTRSWQDYSFDLKDKLNIALDRLDTISCGQYYTDECSTNDDAVFKARKTAVLGLKKISKMRERKI